MKNIKIDDINGFKGAELFKELDAINSYVNGISKQLIEENRVYLIVNILLIVIFFIAFVVFNNFQISYYYKERYDIICNSCVIIRDFKSLFIFNNDKLINPL